MIYFNSSDSDSDSDNYDKYNKKIITCYKCKLSGHYANNCYLL
jgi:hypothetical protein